MNYPAETPEMLEIINIDEIEEKIKIIENYILNNEHWRFPIPIYFMFNKFINEKDLAEKMCIFVIKNFAKLDILMDPNFVLIKPNKMLINLYEFIIDLTDRFKIVSMFNLELYQEIKKKKGIIY